MPGEDGTLNPINSIGIVRSIDRDGRPSQDGREKRKSGSKKRQEDAAPQTDIVEVHASSQATDDKNAPNHAPTPSKPIGAVKRPQRTPSSEERRLDIKV